MRTTLDIPGELIEEARRLLGFKSKTETVVVSLREDHSPRRQVFSCAHEYCHVLVDRDRGGLVSRVENREDLTEVRSNAFAAAFLMPESGVRTFVRRLGKGEQSRSQLRAYDETDVVEGQRRQEAHSQDVQVYDVAHVAHHFGVSYETALYRLLNLKLITEEERAQLAQQKEMATGIMRFLGPEPDAKAPGHKPFRHQFVLLAVEGYRREAISRAKLKELCSLAQVLPGEFKALVATVDAMSKALKKVAKQYLPGKVATETQMLAMAQRVAAEDTEDGFAVEHYTVPPPPKQGSSRPLLVVAMSRPPTLMDRQRQPQAGRPHDDRAVHRGPARRHDARTAGERALDLARAAASGTGCCSWGPSWELKIARVPRTASGQARRRMGEAWRTPTSSSTFAPHWASRIA